MTEHCCLLWIHVEHFGMENIRQPEYLFSISGTSDTTTSMETADPNVALVCVPSTAVINSLNVLPNSAEHPLSILSITHPSDTPTEEIAASIL